MSGLDFTRQSGLIPGEAAERTKVVVVGAGAIGSHVTEVLCKMGIRHIQVIDYDTIEPHNLPNQGYYLQDLGRLKVEALAERLGSGTGAQVVPVNQKLEGIERFDCDILISAVDSMAVRRLIFDSFICSTRCSMFIDTRMGARFGKVLLVRKDDESMSRYESTLHSDDEGYQEPCTQKSTIFCAYGLSSVVGAVVAKYLMGEELVKSADVDFSNMFMDRVA